jgi:hypothetical protein
MLLTLFVVPSAYHIFNTAAERLGLFLPGRDRTPAPTRRRPAEVGAD